MDVRSVFRFTRTGTWSTGELRASPNFLAIGFAACLSLIGARVEASDQGHLGAVSKGSISISVTVVSRAEVSGVSDFEFAQLNSTSGTQSQAICVWSTSANRQYSVQAVGSGTGNAFTISDDQSTTRYEVVWTGQPGQASASTLRPGASLVGLVAAANEAECSSNPGSNAILSVAVASRDTSGKGVNASQTGSLQLLIAPE